MKIVCFWALHAIFFFGSVFFRTKAFLKTGLIVFLAYFACQLALLVAFLIVCLVVDGIQEASQMGSDTSQVALLWARAGSLAVFLPCILAPVGGYLTYRRFRKAEV